MNAVKWVLIDNSKGATTHDGSKLTPDALAHHAEAVQNQVNGEFAAEWGAHATLRVGKNMDDIQHGEWAYVFLKALPDAPEASAYHDVKKGVPYALCAVSTCGSLFGSNGIGVDVSHEILETAGDEGANLYADDNKGTLHALEMCDAVEIQTYGKVCADGTIVKVSNWLLRSWFIPGAAGPFDYMSEAKIPGAVAPHGPLQTAHGQGGNYQIISKAGASKQIFAAERHIDGIRRKGMVPHWSSRTALRLKKLAGEG
jgi:hypothetical protein